MHNSPLVRCPLFFFSSRRRHTRWPRDWSSDVCSSDLNHADISNNYFFNDTCCGGNGRVILSYFRFVVWEIGRASCRERVRMCQYAADVYIETRKRQRTCPQRTQDAVRSRTKRTTVVKS